MFGRLFTKILLPGGRCRIINCIVVTILLFGAGPTIFGANLKGGIFLKNHFLVGGTMEVHELFSSRKEAGLFARKYINSNRFSVFVQAGPSYGSFQEWDFDMDN